MFKAKNEKAYWQKIYDLVADAEVNTVFTYKDLNSVTGIDIRRNRTYVYRANKELMKVNKRILVAEQGVGYRLVEGMEQFYHAEERHTKANKQITLANFEAMHVNQVVLTPDEKNTLQQFLVDNRRIARAMQQQVDNVGFTQMMSVIELKKLKELLSTV